MDIFVAHHTLRGISVDPMPANTRSLFTRTSLVEQITEALRDSIRNGSLSKKLPSERMLCEMFNASRPIIRQALHALRDDGWLQIRRGHPAKAIKRASPKTASGEKRRVNLLFTEPGSHLSQWALMAIDEIRRQFYSQGFHFELLMEPAVNRKRPQALLQKLLDQHPSHHWILAGASAAVQKWFQEKPLNVVMMGNIFPQMHLPFVNNDLRGAARHAAGVFLRMGHRRIVFLRRDTGTAGEPSQEAGFLDAFHARPDAEGSVITHTGRVSQIRAHLERIFAREPRVTALLVSHAEDTLVAMNWFFEKGLQLPRDVSLISYQWESFLERLRPLPAWYYTDPTSHARKLCRLILSPSPARKSPRLVIPVFRQNDTVADLRPPAPLPRTATN